MTDTAGIQIFIVQIPGFRELEKNPFCVQIPGASALGEAFLRASFWSLRLGAAFLRASFWSLRLGGSLPACLFLEPPPWGSLPDIFAESNQ